MRNKNIKNINFKQSEDIKKLDSKVSDILKSSNFEINNRSLVLYFRHGVDNYEQVDCLEFSIMYYILDWYITQGYSKVFNNLSVVSRKPNEIPKYFNDLFENFNYLSATNTDSSNVDNFNFVTSIGANTIHFVDGDYLGNISHCSIPIVSESIKYADHIYSFITKSEYKIKLYKNKKVILMDGIYYDRENRYIEKEMGFMYEKFKMFNRGRNTGDFYKLMNSVLSAVIKLENKMLKNVEK